MDGNTFHRTMSVNNLTYSPLFSDEVFENSEWHLYSTGLDTCKVLKSDSRHGKQFPGTSIQSAKEVGII